MNNRGEKWNCEVIRHGNFKDLGNYVIELPDFTDPSILERGIVSTNARYDHGDISRLGCTAMATANKAGEVIIGRNMDVEISQYPAYVFKTTFGKYKTFAVTYLPGNYMTYAEVQKIEYIDEDFLETIAYSATDVMNEAGLYIESNMRTAYPELSNYGLHSSRGERFREDGKPWSELRACNMTLSQLVAQNCSTVKEALDFISNSYDWYTMGIPQKPEYDGWNMCQIIGDATGEFGLIEMAQDRVSYLPYQCGQANYYITPQWGVLDKCGSGYGRLDRVHELLHGIETADEAMNAMKAVMWRNETLWVGESVRADVSTNPNPYSQTVFQDDKGNRQLDWRSDHVMSSPVLDDGRMLVFSDVYENAGKSSYDPDIRRYFDEAVARGTLIIDDGSITFDVNGEACTLTKLRECYEAYEAAALDPEKQKALSPYFTAYRHLLSNENAYWTLDDHNFEALKAATYEMLHTRYDALGQYDPKAMSKYEKLKAFYGYDVDRNESFLRDDGAIWTTSLNVGVNCSEKLIRVRFWENDDVIYSVKWE